MANAAPKTDRFDADLQAFIIDGEALSRLDAVDTVMSYGFSDLEANEYVNALWKEGRRSTRKVA